jgi:hypothetical protein
MPYILIGAGIITLAVAYNIPTAAPPGSFLREQQMERNLDVAVLGLALMMVGGSWFLIRLCNRLLSKRYFSK